MAGYSTQFGTDLLNRLGLPVTAANLQYLQAWAQAEGGGAAFNPFNTTQGASGASNYNPTGVRNYTSYEQGLEATVQTLQNGYYGPILAALKAGNSAMATAQALAGTPWGTGTLVEKVLGGKVATSSSGTNGTMSDPTSPNTVAPPVIDFNTISSDFASVAGLLDAVPELKAWAQNIVNKQIQVDTPGGRAQAEQMLEQTQWWKTTSNAQRTYQQLKITNPGEAAAQVGAARSAIQAQAAAMGVTLNPSDLNTWALRKVGFGWTDQQITAGLAGYLKKSDPTKISGQGGVDVNAIQKLAASYGITPTNYQLAAWTSEIEGGSQSIGGLQNYMMMQAKLIYPGLAKQIDQGMTVAQVAGAYQTEMGNVLELNPDTLDFTKDPLLKQALQYNPGLTKQGAVTAASQKATGATTAAATPETMPLYQFDQLLKNDPRWLETQNAKSTALSMVQDIGRSWGFSA